MTAHGANTAAVGLANLRNGSGSGSDGGGNNGKLIGENGTKLDGSRTVWNDRSGGSRIDVENFEPGKRAGNIHYQDDKKYPNQKFYYDFQANQFKGAPNSLNQRLIGDSRVQRAINNAKNILGEN